MAKPYRDETTSHARPPDAEKAKKMAKGERLARALKANVARRKAAPRHSR